MALTKLGKYLKQSELRNTDGKYCEDCVVGISTQKLMIPTKADLMGVKLSSYKLVPTKHFAYIPDTSRRGDKMALFFNSSDETYIVSSISIVFYIKDITMIDAEYLFMYFNRPEFDRYTRFHSFGSAREIFRWEDMCDIEIDLPALLTQKKYVYVYKSMLANQKTYERGLDELKLVCDAYIENLRRKMPCEEIGPYITRYHVKNGKNSIKNVMSISKSKEFRTPTSKVNRNELENYKIVRPRQIGFVQTTHNEKVFAYAFNNTNKDIVISSVNEVFSVDEKKLMPEYLSMFFNRVEFDRYARFHSWGSARETFTWDDLIKVKIPIPDIKIQKNIIKIYNAYNKRKEINEKMKAQIKAICPILIKGSIIKK